MYEVGYERQAVTKQSWDNFYFCLWLGTFSSSPAQIVDGGFSTPIITITTHITLSRQLRAVHTCRTYVGNGSNFCRMPQWSMARLARALHINTMTGYYLLRHIFHEAVN